MNQHGPSGSGDPFFGQVELTCRVEVAGEMLEVRKMYAAEAYDDPEARPVIEANLRFQVVDEILKRWQPKIEVRR